MFSELGGYPQFSNYTGRVSEKQRHAEGVTYPEELAERRVVWLAWLALDVFLP